MSRVQGIDEIRKLARKALYGSDAALKATPMRPELYRHLWQHYLTLSSFVEGAEAGIRAANGGEMDTVWADNVVYFAPQMIDDDLKEAASLKAAV